MAKEVRYCSIEGCTNQLFSKGWCGPHYRNNYKRGDPLSGPVVKEVKSCGVDGCDRNESIRSGYCSVHYQRFLKDGIPGPPVGVYNHAKAEIRFWEKVDKSGGEDACWPWTGQDCHKGYGKVRINKVYKRTHRAAYEFHHKSKLAAHEPVHHTCSNRKCVNPRHLQLTTVQENTAEMLERRYYLAKIAELEGRLEKCNCHVQGDNK